MTSPRHDHVPFSSTKQALAAAGRVSLAMSFPKADGPRVQSSPDPNRSDYGSAVRACLVRAGIDPWGEEADRLYRQACESDDAADDYDDLTDAEVDQLLAEGRTLARDRQRVAAELRRAGLIPIRRRTEDEFGYRVSEDADGRRTVRIVCDPDPKRDPTVYTGPGARERALAVAAGRDDGPVVPTSTPEQVKHADVWAELVPRWRSGELATVGQLDTAIAEQLGCSVRHARRIRRSWGVRGTNRPTPRRALEVPPVESSE